MSLVGTRPILQDELLKYELHHRARIAIKPGITGMWQVSGRSDAVVCAVYNYEDHATEFQLIEPYFLSVMRSYGI